MKKTFIAAAFLCVSSLGAKTEALFDYYSLKKALIWGYSVRTVIYYGNCLLVIEGEAQDESPDAVGGMSIETFEIFPRGFFGNEYEYISFSENSLVFMKDRYVINYVKLRVYENDSVYIRAQYIDPVSYETVMDEEFLTAIRDEERDGGIVFFSRD